MDSRPADIDASRAAITGIGLAADAAVFLTDEVAVHLPAEARTAFEEALERFFGPEDWTSADDDELAGIVSPHMETSWFEHHLGSGLRLAHGIRKGRYVLWVTGSGDRELTVFDRAFSGPVVPERTRHPRRVKFRLGGDPAPGRWYRQGEEVDDEAAAALLEDPEVTDVMLAGDFVTVGLQQGRAWELRLDDLLDRVTELFWAPGAAAPAGKERAGEEPIGEGPAAGIADARPEDLHHLDPDEEDHREALIAALDSADPRARRAAVAVLATSTDRAVAAAALLTGYHDAARMVRKTAIDAAADLEDDSYRPLFEKALDDEDPWTRWRSVRAMVEIGAEPSIEALMFAAVDRDPRVSSEATSALRSIGQSD